jgi:hypothetical protein
MAACTTYKPDPERPGTVIKKIQPSWHLEQNGPWYEQVFDQDARWYESGYKKPIVCARGDVDWFDLDEPQTNWKGDKEVRRLGCRNKETTEHYTLKYSHGITQPSMASLFIGPLVQGAMFMGGMALLGTQIRSGLVNQPVGSGVSPLRVDQLRISTANFGNQPIPGVVP